MEKRNHKNSGRSLALNFSSRKVAVVVSEFNADITGNLLAGALWMLKKHGVKEAQITVKWAPGSIEIPLMCQRLARTKKYHGLIALGSVIKGDTDHYYY